MVKALHAVVALVVVSTAAPARAQDATTGGAPGPNVPPAPELTMPSPPPPAAPNALPTIAPPPTGIPPLPATTPSAAQPPAPSQTAPALTEAQAETLARVNAASLDDMGERDGISPAILRAEVMLDRVHASPGVIDGRRGDNFVHALRTYEKARRLKASGRLDPKVWAALLAASGGPVLMDYALTDADVAGPFYPDLPRDYAKLATLPSLGYRSPAQKIGAKFHMGEELLAALNPGADLAKAGTHLVVAVVTPRPIDEHVARIIVDKQTRQVLGYDRKGRLLVAYPATIGSRELPSPSGTYKVKGVAYDPKYYYDPKNFVQGDNHEKLTLPAGPNNPVGSVFIALSKPTYGLHGTPDPSKIDKTASHGCVRMTNWDANELAHLVRPGVVVHFKG